MFLFQGSNPVTRSRKPDRLVKAECTRLDVSLTFADGFSKTVRLRKLGIRRADYDLTTLRVSAAGDMLQVETREGEAIEIDSWSLRSDLDPNFAATLRDELLTLRGPIAELKNTV